MLPEALQTLAKASRDFAEVQMTYKSPEVLCSDIRKAFEFIHAQQQEIDDLKRRINQIRNARDEMLVQIQGVYKRFDFTLRAV